MRTVERWEEKAKLAGEISDFILSLSHPMEREDDEDAVLWISVKESGQRVTRLYGKRPLLDNLVMPPKYNDGTIYESCKMQLDKETREYIISALQRRLEALRDELTERNFR